MTSDGGSNQGRLLRTERDALINSISNTVQRKGPIPQPQPVAAKWDTDFRTLAGYCMIETQRKAAAMLGLKPPFYREHGAMAGAKSVIGNRDVINYASYDYVGLNGDPRIVSAVTSAAREWGTSVSASRLTAGERPVVRELEQTLAKVYGTEAALVFVSGHATNVTTIPTLVGPKDLILHDSLSHNSLVVGAEYSGAVRRSFAHNNLDALEVTLAQLRDRYERCLIITEGMFSMDGDGPDLARLIDIKSRWGAWLMVDEAHSLGVLGKTGLGIAEHQSVETSGVDIWMGTLSKTLVSCGGYICGSAALIELLKYNAPGMVYSVGLPVTASAASLKALEIMLGEPARVARLQTNGKRFLDRARAAGLDVGDSWGHAISPVIIGDSLRTVLLHERLLEQGINAAPIIPPGVPEKSARLRFFISSAHTDEDIDTAVDVTARELSRLESEGVSVSNLAHLLL